MQDIYGQRGVYWLHYFIDIKNIAMGEKRGFDDGKIENAEYEFYG
jgi:hypothetical protein